MPGWNVHEGGEKVNRSYKNWGKKRSNYIIWSDETCMMFGTREILKPSSESVNFCV